MLTTLTLRKALFSSSAKTVNPITKIAHARFDLAKMLQPNNLPLIRQNVKNRKADSYADPDRVLALHNEFKTIRFELDQLRKRRNDHAALTKQLVTIEDEALREGKLREHTKVGKTFKQQVQDREKTLEIVEHELVEQALKLPNKTHYDSPVGDESKNRQVASGGP